MHTGYAGAVLRDMWRLWLPLPEDDDPEWVEIRAPFTWEWPGLAAPERTALTPAERQHALDGKVICHPFVIKLARERPALDGSVTQIMTHLPAKTSLETNLASSGI
jgi:hypothetical protein